MRFLLTSASAFFFSAGLATAQSAAIETCLFQEENWPEVLEACNTALDASDDPTEQGRFILHRAIALEELGDIEGAVADQVLVGDFRPDWFRGYANAASLSYDLGDMEAHARWAQAAIDAEPENPRAYFEMLFALVNGEDPPSCEPIAEQIIGLLPHPVDWAFMAAPDPHLMGNLGYCLQQLERWDMAVQAYLAAEQQGLEAAWLHSNLAYVAQYHLDRPDLGVEHATRALEMGERSLYDADSLVYALVDLGDLDGALEVVTDFADLLDTQEEDWGTRNIVGWELFLEGRLDEASTVMEAWAVWAEAELAAGRESYGYIWDTLAHIRAGLGDTEGAWDAFRLAFEHYGDQDAARELYSAELATLGFDIGEGDAGLLAALEACAATGPACRLIPDEDEARVE